jgi:asparagine synthase (glutamine-hydrolysing)
MSGIVGIVNLDGRPVSRELLRQMTDFMAYRGPDAQEIWSEGHVGFGHTMLRTTGESLKESQPLSLDGKVWITADARIDGRKELIGKLESKVAADLTDVTDVELILHAYNVWGEGCLEHLIGDFAFAIWDGRERRLFCARDHFGVKPFYYAQVDNSLIFSNTLDCVRLHPAVSDELNDAAIGDFLLADYNHDPATTVFVDIQRLPAAHCLNLFQGTAQTKRYWTLPADGHIRYRRSSEYIDHFKDLFFTAVNDRLRTDSVGVFMSGGLDSPSVAATAHELLSKRSSAFDLQAYTVVYDRLIPDQERYYSGLVAKKLGIKINYLVADDYSIYERWDEPELSTPEPEHDPLAAISVDQYKQVADCHRVVLTGYGGDPALYSSQLDPRFGNLLLQVGSYVASRRRIRRLGVRNWVKSRLGKPLWPFKPPYPGWLNQAFAARLDLPSRYRQLNSEPAQIHPVRPHAYKLTTGLFWPYRFETCDSGVTAVACEVRHPFFDLRLLEYLFAIPPIPWFVQKDLLRMTMRDILPEPVRSRPKAPLAGDPYFERLRNYDSLWWHDHFIPKPELARYIEPGSVARVSHGDAYDIWVNARPLSLNYWLQKKGTKNHDRINKEKYYGVTKERGR